MDISGLTLQIAGENVFGKGRFYMLWRVVILFSHLANVVSEATAAEQDGNFIVIQAAPWWRRGLAPNHTLPIMSHYLEEHRALWHLQEVIQTMLDTIVFDGENNWAYLIRLKDNTYRMVYEKRRLVNNCPIWTKVGPGVSF